MKRSIYPLLFLFVIVLSSCSSNYLKVKIISPPVNRTPGSFDKVCVVNCVAYRESINSHLEADYIYFRQARDGSNAACNGIADIAERNSVVVEPVEYHGNDSNTRIIHFKDLPRSYDYKTGSRNTLVFVIDYFYVYSHSSEPELNSDSVPSYYASRSSHFETRIYSYYLSSEGEVYSDFPAYNGLDIDGIGVVAPTEQEVKDSLPTIREVSEKWGYAAGADYAEDFFSTFYFGKVRFFKSGNKNFDVALEMIKDSCFTSARNILLNLSLSGDKKTSAGAFYDLAVLSLYLEENKDVLFYLYKSLDIMYLQEAADLKSKLSE